MYSNKCTKFGIIILYTFFLIPKNSIIILFLERQSREKSRSLNVFISGKLFKNIHLIPFRAFLSKFMIFGCGSLLGIYPFF